MSIQTQINRLKSNISAALSALAAKGVAVPAGAKSDDLAGLIDQVGGVDTANDTVTESVLLYGYTAHNAAGNAIIGIAGARVEGEALIHNGTVTGETLEWGDYQWPILVASS